MMGEWQIGIPKQNGTYVFRIRNLAEGRDYFSLVRKEGDRFQFCDNHPRDVLPNCDILFYVQLPELPMEYHTGNVGGINGTALMTNAELKGQNDV